MFITRSEPNRRISSVMEMKPLSPGRPDVRQAPELVVYALDSALRAQDEQAARGSDLLRLACHLLCPPASANMDRAFSTRPGVGVAGRLGNDFENPAFLKSFWPCIPDFRPA